MSTLQIKQYNYALKYGAASTITITDGTLFAAINALGALGVLDAAVAGTEATRSYNIYYWWQNKHQQQPF